MVIRLLAREDLDGALALSSTAGWNQRLEDWRMLLDLAPSGSFAAIVDGRIVGTAIGIDYSGFSWIAMMLVEPAWRGRGIGRGLLEAAMNAVPAGAPIRLDATPMGRPLYQAYGFQDEAVLTRLTAGAPAGAAGNEPERSSAPDPGAVDRGGAGVPRRSPAAVLCAPWTLNARPMSGADLPTISECDRGVFGGDRSPVLAWALGLAPHYCHVCQREGVLAGYCLGRRGRLYDEIGPVVADSEQVARALLAAALHGASGQALIIDSFDARTRFGGWVQACGFQAQRPLFRMRRPPASGASVNSQEGSRLAEFTILGPEFA